MKIPNQRLLATFALAALCTACSTVQVHADYNPKTNFSNLNSYAWLPESQSESLDRLTGNPLVSERVIEAVERELQALGYTQVTSGANFEIGFSLALRRGVDVHTEPVFYGRYARRRDVGLPYGSEVRIYEYQEGVLQIDFVDPKTNTLLWRGTGRSRLSEDLTPEQSTTRINAIVAKLLAQFPPH